MKKIWRVKEPQHSVKSLAEALKIENLTAEILLRRGYESSEDAYGYMHPSLDRLHDPMLMANMEIAVERIQQGIDKKEKIWIYGDYDVGATRS